MEEEEGKK